MKNLTEVRTELAAVFKGLKDGTIEPKNAVEMNNCAGKIINSLKVELAYYAMRGQSPDIPYLNSDTTKLIGSSES